MEGSFVALGFVVGFFVAVLICENPRTAHDVQVEAVEAGVAEWIAQPDGSTKFEWKTVCP